MPLPSQSTRPKPVEWVAELDLNSSGTYTWEVVSDCGVVKLYSSRDGCMIALNPVAARRLASELAEAMNAAADKTEIRSYGKVVSR